MIMNAFTTNIGLNFYISNQYQLNTYHNNE